MDPSGRPSAATSRSLNPWPLLASLAVFAAGLVLCALGQWRVGLWTCAGGLVLAGVLRLVLPRRSVGLLRVRHQAVDVVLLLGAGVAMAVLAYLR
ncbi:DUF3017 domain-containing protein [Desertihabitans aurantiacus]|uniref:DUF3017 domain-containing protein n=1 Tax=Desertihabitans aurantiacus TaxID=2282477 RepID=UPI000DF7D9C0|nr:DUF3017 domain-containing protein [Desertihabitans aurantiacus]